MAAATEDLERELFGLLHDARTTNSLAIAGLTLVLIEHLANFRDEVNLVWKARLSLSTTLSSGFVISLSWYYGDRLFHCTEAFLSQLMLSSVDVSFMLRDEKSDHGQMATSTVIILSADLILVLRVWILYGRKRSLLYFLIPLITAEMIAMITIGIFTIGPLEKYLHIGPILGGCYSLKVPRLFTFYAVPSFVTSVIMFLMTLRKCGATILSLGPGTTPIIALFLRDGVFWFLALVRTSVHSLDVVVSVVEIVLWDRARPTLAQIPVVPAISLIAVIGARVVLNIKHVASNADLDMGAVTAAESETDSQVPIRRSRTERIPWYLRTTDTACTLFSPQHA
ncbi:hypothetical protein C8R46DRAFT_1218602 [Mycena filopes]|nr:hypothetical protein C8R46DRAFT_1218602 [Mycena filopes]